MLSEIKKELKSIEELAHSFAIKELLPKRQLYDRYPFGPFYDDVLIKAHQIGLFSITLPDDCGGAGYDISALSVILKQISSVDASLSGIILTNAIAQKFMFVSGNKKLLIENITQAKDIKSFLLAYTSFLNPNESKLNLEALKYNDHYRLNGTIEFVVLGGITKYAIVPAYIKDKNDFAFFLIDLTDKNISKGNTIFSLGLHACPAVDLTIKDVKAIRLGDESGARYFEQVSSRLCVAVSAIQCGIMKGCFDEALAYSKQRFQGGKEIINWSELKMILGNMALQLKIADMVLTSSVLAVEQGFSQYEVYSKTGALHLSELACEHTTNGIQVLGGYGYMKDYGQEKRFRDAKQTQSFFGFSPLQRLNLINETMRISNSAQ